MTAHQQDSAGLASEAAASPQPDRPAKARKPDRRRARTRQAILDAAEHLFGERGVEPTTVEEIADLAGMSVGTLYFHFGNKEGVLHALVGRLIDSAEGSLEETRAAASPLERVLLAGDVYFRFATQQPVAFRFIAAGIPDLGPDAPAETAAASRQVSDRIGAFVQAIAADLRQAMDAGEIDPVPVDEAMAFIWGSWNGVIGLVVREDRFAITPELAEQALKLGRQVLLSGLGAALPDDARTG